MGEFGSGEVDDALQEGTADSLTPIGRQDNYILDARLPSRRRLKDAQCGAADYMLFIVLRDEDPRSGRCHRTLLHLRGHRYFRVQLLHKSQQIIDLGSGQSTKFKISHSIRKLVLHARSCCYTQTRIWKLSPTERQDAVLFESGGI